MQTICIEEGLSFALTKVRSLVDEASPLLAYFYFNAVN